MRRLWLAALIISLCLGWAQAIQAQNQPVKSQGKKLSRIALPDEPVKLICQSYGADDDWLKDLIVDVENVSGRQILELDLTLIIKGDGSFEHPILLPLTQVKAPDRSTNVIAVGGRARLAVTDSDYQKAKAQITRTISLAAINQAELLIRRANFGNGRGWYRGADLLRGDKVATQIAEVPSLGCNQANTRKQLDVVNALPKFGDQIIEPIKITGQRFPDQDDWLRNLEIEVENTSQQNITYIELIVLICDIKSIDYCISIPLRYPALGEANDANLLGTKPILPGTRVKLTVAESAYLSAKELIEKSVPLSSINKADLIIGQINYQNASGGWINQSLLRNFAWELYKPGTRAFTLAKDVYIWGYLRNRERTYSDMYLGMEATYDEPELEYLYDENGTIRSVRVKGYVRKGGGYVREYEKERDRQRQRQQPPPQQQNSDQR